MLWLFSFQTIGQLHNSSMGVDVVGAAKHTATPPATPKLGKHVF